MEVILKERLSTIQEISEVTAEHLRLMQRQAGMQVLNMREDDATDVSGQMDRNEKELAQCEQKVDVLEQRLARLDEELEAQVEGGET
ncbi:hypothetical protein [Antarctobacter jejuensis]|uniref:hypothetical protein n=1 Tax=Antarctobacter jejuensis TaxID=1439938 RepID=UPI003FD06902